MSQHDYIISNDTGANVRSDLNNALGAIATINSGATEPSTTYAYQLWMDTSSNVLKIRNSANSAWYTLPISPVANNTVDINGGTVDGITSLSVSGTSSLNGAVVINESGADVDFRIESDTNANAFFLEGSSGNVGVGTSSPSSFASTANNLVVSSSSSATGITIHSTGDSNVYFADGTSGSEPYRGIVQYSHGSDAMRFYTAATERMRIDSSGNVGIGNSNTNYQLTSGEKRLRVGDGSEHATIDIYAGTTKWSALTFSDANTNSSFVGQVSYYHNSNYMQFNTNGSEAMRIDSSGNLLVGKTSASTNAIGGEILAGGTINAITDGANCLNIRRFNSYGTVVNFLSTFNTTVGSITHNDSSTSYLTSSDYRLKEDWQPMSGSIDRLKALNPVNFAWISSGERVDGFLAHEAQEVVPEAVTGTKDAMRTEEYEVTPAVLDDDGNVVTEAVMGEREVPDYQGIDQAKLVPLLTAALQEAVSKIEALETRIAALEA